FDFRFWIDAQAESCAGTATDVAQRYHRPRGQRAFNSRVRDGDVEFSGLRSRARFILRRGCDRENELKTNETDYQFAICKFHFLIFNSTVSNECMNVSQALEQFSHAR